MSFEALLRCIIQALQIHDGQEEGYTCSNLKIILGEKTTENINGARNMCLWCGGSFTYVMASHLRAMGNCGDRCKRASLKATARDCSAN